jgi:hypothetical protein
VDITVSGVIFIHSAFCYFTTIASVLNARAHTNSEYTINFLSMQRVDRFRGIARLLVQFSERKFQPASFTKTATFCGKTSSARHFSSSPQVKMSYGVVERGCPNSLEYRMFFSKYKLLLYTTYKCLTLLPRHFDLGNRIL